MTDHGAAFHQDRKSPRVRSATFLSLVDGTADRLDPAAAHVVERLSHAGPLATDDLELARRRYVASRWALLAPKQPVESVLRVRPANLDAPPLVFIRPLGSDPREPLPALVFLHGGGWTLGGFETYEPLCRELANATGRVIVWVEYRLAPEHPFPAALEDSWNAIEWLRNNADWLAVDRDRIAIGGDSAGGNLAAVTALAARNGIVCFAPEFQLLIYPCLDLTANTPSHYRLAEGYLLTAELYRWYRRNYLGDFPDPLDWHLSPLFAEELDGAAPAIIVYAGFDPLRDEAAMYSARLRSAGTSVETIFFPGMIHGFMTMGGAVPTAHVAVARVAAAIAKLDGARALPSCA